MVDQRNLATSFLIARNQKPDCLIVGSLGVGDVDLVANLQHYAELAGAVGCHAIRVPYYGNGSFFATAEPRGGVGMAAPVHIRGELKPSDIEECAQRCLGCLSVVVAVYNLTGLEEIAGLDGIAMLAVPAPAATDPQLTARVAETGLPTLLEVNLLSAARIEDALNRFAPGRLTLMWTPISSAGAHKNRETIGSWM
jgi:hypothetical protein